MSPIGIVYLIRLDQKLSHVQYYIGFTTRHPLDRLEDHRTGKGARLLEVATEKGIAFHIVRIWENVPKTFERQLKNQKNHRRLCPIHNKERQNLYKQSHK
jgi:predicted GIY-YIG superfamily endonuclease